MITDLQYMLATMGNVVSDLLIDVGYHGKYGHWPSIYVGYHGNYGHWPSIYVDYLGKYAQWPSYRCGIP